MGLSAVSAENTATMEGRPPMRRVPTLDWTCSHCGNKETWELVKVDREGARPEDRPVPRREAPTLDLSCSRCGTSETYMLVKAGVTA